MIEEGFRFKDLITRADRVRDNFLSRYFALYAEDVVRLWAQCPEAEYEDLGRPTLYVPGTTKRSTIDFTLRHRVSGRVAVGELKCELAFENYKYLTLIEPGQLDHHKTEAFSRFLKCANDPKAFEVRVKSKNIDVAGGILIWGAVAKEGRQSVMERFGFLDVLSVESMIADLKAWRPGTWSDYLDTRNVWVSQLSRALHPLA